MVTLPLTGTFFESAENDGEATIPKTIKEMITVMTVETRFTPIGKTSTTRISTAFTCRQTRCKFKTRSSAGLYEIDIYRLDFLKQIFIDMKMNVSIREYQIFFQWLIQSHA